MRLFISYRRDEDPWVIRSLQRELVQLVGEESVFLDIDAIPPGVDYVEFLDAEVEQCDVLLALIGPKWQPEKLTSEDDFVRIEISAALARGIPVVPVMIRGAQLPTRASLPTALHALVRRQGVTVSDATYHSDIKRMVEGLHGVLERDNSTSRPSRYQTDLAALWQQTQDELKQLAPQVAGLLEGSSIVLNDDSATITVPSEARRTMLERRRNLDRLKAALARQLGRDVEVVFEVAPRDEPDATKRGKRSFWQQTQDELKQLAPQVAGLLEGSSIVLNDDSATITVPSEARRTMLERGRNLDRLKAALARQLGRDVEVVFEVAPRPKSRG